MHSRLVLVFASFQLLRIGASEPLMAQEASDVESKATTAMPEPPGKMDAQLAKEAAEAKATAQRLLLHWSPNGNKAHPLQVFTTELGSIRWGNLFAEDEVAALVSVTTPAKENPIDEEVRTDLLFFFAWEEGHWSLRQSLGAVKNLQINRRETAPRHFLQDLIPRTRDSAEASSWVYGPASKKLERTGWDDWRPFYIVGDYLCFSRGLERRTFEETRWIYDFKGGKKGSLLGFYESHLSAIRQRFSVGWIDPTSKKEVHWGFAQHLTENSHYLISHPDFEAQTVELILPEGNELDHEQVFRLLTGLNHHVLNNEWNDHPAFVEPVKLQGTLTGPEEMVRRLDWLVSRLK